METNISRETNINNQATTPKRIAHHQEASHSHEIPHHLWSFFISIVLTGIAFLAVGLGVIENGIALGAFILLLAIIQVVFQMAVWMHMNQKGHEYPVGFILSGVFVAVITVAALMLLIWW